MDFLNNSKGYIFGVICGDGHIMDNKKSGNYGINLQSKDLDFIKEFQKNVKIVYKKDAKYFEFKRNGNIYYNITLYGKEIIKNLKKELFSTYTWRAPIICFENKEFRIGFLKGIFDSEGSVSKPIRHWEKRKYKDERYKIFYEEKLGKRKSHGIKRRIRLSSINYLGISDVKKLLSIEDIKSCIFKTRSKTSLGYCLEIEAKINCEKFMKKIGFSIKRKNKRLKALIDMTTHKDIIKVNNINY